MVKQLNYGLTNSWNNSVTTTKCISTLIASTAAGGVGKVASTAAGGVGKVASTAARGVGKVLLWCHNQKPFTAYQHFDRQFL